MYVVSFMKEIFSSVIMSQYERRKRVEIVTSDTFKSKVMENKKPVVLEFHGSLCAACIQVEKELNEAEAQYGNQIFFGMVNADEEELMNTALQVYDLPALFFFKNGHVVARHNGFFPYDTLKKLITQLLNA